MCVSFLYHTRLRGQITVLILTFFSYASLHVTRKSFSFAKVNLAYPSCHGRGVRDHCQQYKETSLGLQIVGLLHSRIGLSLLHRLGSSHVFDWDGNQDIDFLPDDNNDHFDSLRDHSNLFVYLLVGRIDSIQHTYVVCPRLPSYVRYRWTDWIALRLQLQRYSSSRHLLRHWSLPLCGGSRDNIRLDSRNLFLVSEDDRKVHERILGESAFLGFLYFHEPHLPTDVCSRYGWYAASNG